jgi:predicted TIM-barrel fold metal-dependent hydrolase
MSLRAFCSAWIIRNYPSVLPVVTLLARKNTVPSRNGIVIHFEKRIYVLSRRQFLTSTLAVGMALKASAQPAKRIIVDAQVHLWKAEADWKVLGMKPQMPEPFTIEKLVPLMDQAGVDRVIVVPPGDRNDYALEAAKRYPNRFAVMGRIALRNPLMAVLLPKWKQLPGMLGVRLTGGAPDWFWSGAEKAGLPVMFLSPGRNAELARVAERYPQLQVIAITWASAPTSSGKAGLQMRSVRPLRSPST